jgi:hypothetical protein
MLQLLFLQVPAYPLFTGDNDDDVLFEYIQLYNGKDKLLHMCMSEST